MGVSGSLLIRGAELPQLSNELGRQGITAVTDAGARNGAGEWEALAP